MADLKVGDVIILISGSPKMTVTLKNDLGDVSLSWFDQFGNFSRTEIFPLKLQAVAIFEEEEKATLKEGDRVQLKSDGPVMVLNFFETNNPETAHCVYFANGELKTEKFPAEALRLAPESDNELELFN